MIGFVDRVRRRRRDADDEGFTLVYVMLVSMLVMIGVTSMLVITSNNLVPARRSQDNQAALAAANAGIQDAIAWLNSSTGCPQRGTRCDTALGMTGSNTRTGSDVLSGSGETFTWKVGSAYVTDGSGNTFLRITSTGGSGSATKQLVADVQGINGVLDYEYYSTYETLGASELNRYFASRNIPITCSVANGANTSTSALRFTCAGTSATASWGGAAAGAPSDSVCDKLWYNSATLNGTGGTAGRASIEASSGVTAGNDWAESGSVTQSGQPLTAVTRQVPCQVAFTQGMSFDGPVYTVDAPLISNSTIGGAGPTFAKVFNTAWSSANTPPAPIQAFRVDPFVGGTVAANPPSTRTNPQTFSATFNPVVPANACIFYGPTRVLLNSDGTATVTSPQTRTGGSQVLSTDTSCYSGSLGNGRYKVSYATSGNGIIYVKNNGSATTNVPTGQTATDATAPTTTDNATALNNHSVFYLTNSSTTGGSLDTSSVTSPPVSNCSSTNQFSTAGSTCQWSNAWASPGSSWAQDGPGWTKYSSGTNCTKDTVLSTAPANDRLNFECEFNGGSVGSSHDLYSILRQRIYDAIRNNSYSAHGSGTCASNTFNPASATNAQLVCLLQDFLAVANTSGANANATATPAQYAHQYIAKATTTTTSSTTQAASGGGSAPTAPVTGDPLFTSTTGTGPQETKTVTSTVYTVYRQTAVCSLLNLAGICIGTWGWGNDTPQFQVTVPQTVYSNLTTGVPSSSYFPNRTDVTQYTTGSAGANGSTGPGDVYLEGTYKSKLSVLADGDAVITGNTGPPAGVTAPSYGMDVDTLGNVRLFHPVSCVTAPTATANPTAGFCPNDLTGLYTGGLETGGSLSAAHPAMQYCNMLTGLTANSTNPNSCSGVTATGTGAITEVDAALVAQGGSFGTFNFDRAVGLGSLTLKGGLYQLHRGALGVQWELRSTDTGSRASSGTKLQMTYVNLQSAVPYVPAFQNGTVSRYWNVVSVSSADGSG